MNRETPSRTRNTNGASRSTQPSYVGVHTRDGTRQRRNNVGGTFGASGLSQPFYHPGTKQYRGFYNPQPVTRCYVPFGFYNGARTVYVNEAEEVREDYPVAEYETAAPPRAREGRGEALRPAAGSAAAERYMREASDLFASANYPEAARRFRLAAIAAPRESGPLFALGQSLIAIKNYPYAAKVIRRAIDMEPTIVDEGGDLVGVYGSRENFDRVSKQLAKRVADKPEDLHAPFLLGIQQYFSGNAGARDTFAELVKRDRSDRIAVDLLTASERRFKKSAELPAIK